MQDFEICMMRGDHASPAGKAACPACTVKELRDEIEKLRAELATKKVFDGYECRSCGSVYHHASWCKER